MSPTLRALLLPILMLCAFVVTTSDAQAAHHHGKKHHGKSSSSAAAADARYADLIMNPVTGEIYHETDPDGRRYPASLTKMMTLYLLFEALEQHRVTLNTRMNVSEYASNMPQTNLALSEGDSIPVEVAIKALVVRSANDVAVVVGEALGGDVDSFAETMTAKAHALGMRNTVFKNPNGLPNGEQHTTARDMAKLGIALKRDFPRYYPYFATRQFSWNGATYYTHNRVMLRYAGTDGIKTGFIGASGFNVVTSVVRGGRPIVGSVMGGASGAWRDNKMIQLLDQSYKIVAQRGSARGKIYAENLPLPKNGGMVGTGIRAEMAEASVPENAATLDDTAAGPQAAEEEADAGPAKDKKVAALVPARVAPAAAPAVAPVAPMVVQAPVAGAKAPAAPLAVTTAAPVASPFAPVMAAPVKVAAAETPTPWGIQVGAFSSHELAEHAVNQAVQLAKTALVGYKTEIVGPEPHGVPVHRARLTNLTEHQAKTACEKLISNNLPCFIFKAGN